jgi:predicted DNA-binding protein with PD1-like motif
MRSHLLSVLLAAASCFPLASGAHAQAVPEYASGASIVHGAAPGVTATELAQQGRTFRLVFAKGDDVETGLADFAEKNNLTNAHFTAIGAFDSAVIGWSDPPKRAYRVVRLEEEMEVASFTGNITRRNGKPVVHAHCVVGLLASGTVYAGHCLHGRIGITMQMYLTDAPALAAGEK